MPDADADPEFLMFGPISFQPSTGALTGSAGRMRLPPNHAAILEHLMRHHGERVPGTDLARIVRPTEPSDSANELLDCCVPSLAALLRQLTRRRVDIRGRPHTGDGTVRIYDRSGEVRKGMRSSPR